MIKAGPITNNAEDAALSYLLLSETDPNNFYSELYGSSEILPDPHVSMFSNILDLSDIRVGVFHEWFQDSTEPVRRQCKEVLDFLESRGAKVVPISIPHLQTIRLAHGIKISTEFSSRWDKDLSTRPGSIDPSIAITLAIGSTITAVEALSADTIRHWTLKYIQNLYRQHNLTIIANPTVSVLPPVLHQIVKKNGQSDTNLTLEVMKYIFLANFLGMPAYTVPIGFAAHEVTGTNLPIGFHMQASHWRECDLLRLANAVSRDFFNEEKTNTKPRPEFFVDASNLLSNQE